MRIAVNLLFRAEKAGYKAIVVTVDTPFLGQRDADVRNRFCLPSDLRLANFLPQTREGDEACVSTCGSALEEYSKNLIDPSLTWADIKWYIQAFAKFFCRDLSPLLLTRLRLKTITQLPIILKGILTGEDAKLCVLNHVDGIVVSNHGGRQLDTVCN